MRCKHKWKLIDKTILPSAYEQMTKNNFTELKCRSSNPEYFQKKVILVFQCENCPKMRQIVEVNP